MTTHTTEPLRADALPTEPTDAALAAIEDARLQQLATVPTQNLDPVTRAYRDSVVRILDEIRSARRRLAAGLHGICVGCDDEIPAVRLELVPWVTRCDRCARAHAQRF